MRHAIAAMSLLLVLGAGAAAAADGPAADAPSQPPWAAALAAYVRDPVSGAAAMRALGRDRPADLPPFVVLAIADAETRAGHRRTAERFYREVREGDAGQPWQDWADLGLASIAVFSGNGSDARARLTDLADGGGPNSAVATMMMSLMAARAGEFAEAGAGFDRVAASTDASPTLREAARLGSAYARYWQGDLAHAQASFAAVASANPDGRFADDALYGAAWTRVRTGDPGGVAALRDLARATPTGRGGTTSQGAIDLEPAAVLRGSIRRYRRGAVAPPDQMLAGVLDGDGVALARAALHRLKIQASGGFVPTADAPGSRTRPPDEAPSRDPDRRSRPPSPAPEPRAVVGGSWRWGAPVLVLLLVLAAAWRWSRARR